MVPIWVVLAVVLYLTLGVGMIRLFIRADGKESIEGIRLIVLILWPLGLIYEAIKS